MNVSISDTNITSCQAALRKDFIKYSSANILGMLGLSCYILADTYFISAGLGSKGLAALNIALPVYNLIHGTGLMLGMGGATRFSYFRVQKKQPLANASFSLALYSVAVISIFFMLVGGFFSETLTSLLGADTSIFLMTNTYIKILLLYAPIFMLNDLLLCFVRNDGNPKLSMAAMLCGSFSNIVIDYILIFPFHLGIFGAVFATGLSSGISIFVLAAHWMKRSKGFHLCKTNLSFRLIGQLFSLGMPSFITELSSGIVILIFNMILLDVSGNVGVAAYGIIANLALVVTSIYTGLSQGAQPLLSQAYGTENKAALRSLFKYALFTILLLSAFIYLFIFIFADPITTIFNSEGSKALQHMAVPGLKIYFTSVIFTGFNMILSIFFSSSGHPASAQIISVLRGFVLVVPLAFLMAALLGLTGVWFVIPITEWITSFVSLLFLIKYKQ